MPNKYDHKRTCKFLQIFQLLICAWGAVSIHASAWRCCYALAEHREASSCGQSDIMVNMSIAIQVKADKVKEAAVEERNLEHTNSMSLLVNGYQQQLQVAAAPSIGSDP